ncbi:MAG: Ycf66 family protein [Coleofasciculaceae cyanobacterium]
MLAYVLAIAIALGSLAFYLAAFFFPEVHRKEDFYWSGLGLFYALILWVCAGRITGAVLLGQMACVSLLCWLGWQTLSLRQALTAPEAQTQISPEVKAKIESFSSASWTEKLLKPVTSLFRKQPQKKEVSQPEVPQTAVEANEQVTIVDRTKDDAEGVESDAAVPPRPAEAKLVEEAQPKAQTGKPKPEIAEIAPEAELAPSAEPMGDGDPEMRRNPPEVSVATEVVPVEPENPPQQS